uniref:Uncharacterized protein n=1 Tax=Setaria viridis TaxID=4556 RepID=A0A4U6UZ96_SETVI|nr:hypothetical protein SEVIR_4G194200v2 [Setaria viridis]
MRPEFMEEDAGRRVSGTLEPLRGEAAGGRSPRPGAASGARVRHGSGAATCAREGQLRGLSSTAGGEVGRSKRSSAGARRPTRWSHGRRRGRAAQAELTGVRRPARVEPLMAARSSPTDGAGAGGMAKLRGLERPRAQRLRRGGAGGGRKAGVKPWCGRHRGAPAAEDRDGR